MKRTHWVFSLVILALLGGAVAALWWYRSSAILKIAVTPGADRVQPFLNALAVSRTNFSFVLVPAASSTAALEALRGGAVQFAVMRIDQETKGGIRAVAVLTTRFLVQTDANARAAEPDLAFASERLTAILGRPVNADGLDIRAAKRLETAPRSLLTRTSLKITDDQADKLWFLGTARDEPEEADDWRARALTVSRMLVTTERVDRQIVHDVAMQITDVIRSARSEITAAREVYLAPIDETKSVLRAHDGIARFMNREGQGFFERFGDLVYLGMSVLGIILTAFGALIAWLRYRIADNGRRYLTRMRVLVKRASRNPHEIDRVRTIATRLSIRFAQEVAARRIAQDVLNAYEVMQRTLHSWLGTKTGM
ncbi:MAG: hypothetical protein KME20_26630 [Kaiparowitsia implicata GSE-PSE-MK54-09C]|jgi:hypothetical protein|nr:hypothetical protein [Kaiparowitsia implicata GSE-PSE-MK54-09C]